MSNKKGIKYKSKSTSILNQYTPEEIQNFLNSGLTKKVIVANLGVHFKAFDKYIEEHNLIYKTPSKKSLKKKLILKIFLWMRNLWKDLKNYLKKEN